MGQGCRSEQLTFVAVASAARIGKPRLVASGPPQ
jgi:hypothetical protein